MTVRIGEEEPLTVTLEDFRGDWLLVFFYPADFTFVCPTELQALAALEEQFHAAGASILAASTDSWFSHRAWFETDPRLAGVRYPIVADQSQKLSSRRRHRQLVDRLRGRNVYGAPGLGHGSTGGGHPHLSELSRHRGLDGHRLRRAERLGLDERAFQRPRLMRERDV
jgi:peroxiredoxin